MRRVGSEPLGALAGGKGEGTLGPGGLIGSREVPECVSRVELRGRTGGGAAKRSSKGSLELAGKKSSEGPSLR